MEEYQNWSKTISCTPKKYFEPESIHHMREIIKEAVAKDKTVRCVGSLASPSDLWCTSEYMISTKHFDKVLSVDLVKQTITVEAGISLEKINKVLDENGLALQVLPAISTLTIGGVLGTGVHGSGMNNKILSEYVNELDLLCASGNIMHCTPHKNSDIFWSALVNLGALGIITSVTLQCVPMFCLKQTTESLDFPSGLKSITNKEWGDHGKYMYYPSLDRIVRFDISKTNQPIAKEVPSFVWHLFRHHGLLEYIFYFCLVLFSSLSSFLFFAIHKTLFGEPKTFTDKSFKVLHFDCLFSQYVSEWAIPACNIGSFLEELKRGIHELNLNAHSPIEIRHVKKSNAYLSPAHGCDHVYVNIIMFRPLNCDPPGKEEYWAFFEKLALKYNGRPHWAKSHSIHAEQFKKMYSSFAVFQAVQKQLDPNGTFVNDYIKRHILE